MTCGGPNRNTAGTPEPDVTTTCTISDKVKARCSALDPSACDSDGSCTLDNNGACGPSTSASTCAGAVSSASACAAAGTSPGDCTYASTVKISSGSTCKTKLQCVKVWLGSRIRLFALVMTLFLFLERYGHFTRPLPHRERHEGLTRGFLKLLHVTNVHFLSHKTLTLCLGACALVTCYHAA